MKLTELILQLHTIMLKEGNLDVYTVQGCGCCDSHSEPKVNMREDKHYITGYGPAGIYIT